MAAKDGEGRRADRAANHTGRLLLAAGLYAGVPWEHQNGIGC